MDEVVCTHQRWESSLTFGLVLPNWYLFRFLSQKPYHSKRLWWVKYMNFKSKMSTLKAWFPLPVLISDIGTNENKIMATLRFANEQADLFLFRFGQTQKKVAFDPWVAQHFLKPGLPDDSSSLEMSWHRMNEHNQTEFLSC